MKLQILFSGENKKYIFSLSFEFAQSVRKVNKYLLVFFLIVSIKRSAIPSVITFWSEWKIFTIINYISM